MKNDNELKRLILDLIDQHPNRIEKNYLVSLAVVDIEIPECKDRDFLTLSMYDHVGRIVSGVIRDMKKQVTKEDAQFQLVGFEHIQERYSIYEKGEWVLIRTSEMTLAQLYQKVNELVKDRDGLQAHIDELYELIKIRQMTTFDDNDSPNEEDGDIA